MAGTDFSELMQLAADLTQAPAESRPFIRKALRVTATNIKEEARRTANRTGLGGYAKDITYETHEKASSMDAEIGPTPGDAGSFGFVEDGGGGVKSAPQHSLRDALKHNEDDFVRGLEIAVADGLRRAVGG